MGFQATRQLDRFVVQNWLNQLSLSREMLRKVRNLFSQICEEAIDLEYLDRNPVAPVRIPEQADDGAGRERFLTEAEISALEKLPGRERLVFHMLTLLGLRPGELFARRWGDWQADRLKISDDAWRGTIDGTKTASSRGFVSLPRLLQTELAMFLTLSKWTEQQDFIFCARRGIPLDAHNYLRRTFKPRCQALGVATVTFQSLRRTCATYLVKHGNVKDVQAHLRHSRASTTLEIYTKEIPESVKAAVEDLSCRLFPKANFSPQAELFAKERVN